MYTSRQVHTHLQLVACCTRLQIAALFKTQFAASDLKVHLVIMKVHLIGNKIEEKKEEEEDEDKQYTNVSLSILLATFKAAFRRSLSSAL